MPLLADFDLQELLRLGFFALVLVGSLMGGVIKKLRGKSAIRGEDPPTADEKGPSTIPPEQARPAHPVAQAMPARPQTQSTAPPAQAWPSQTAVSHPRAAGLSPGEHPHRVPSAPSPRARPARAPLEQQDRQAPARRPAAPVARPVTRPPRLPTELQTEAAGVSLRRSSRPVAKRKTKPTTAGKVDKPKRRTLEQKMRARDAAAQPAIVAQEIGDQIDTIRNPTRSSLRRAILLNEVLSPPLALRSPDDGF